MKIAVTGASGFIGRHVLAALRGHDVDVVAASRQVPAIDPPSPRLRWVALDLARPPTQAYAHLGRPDVLLHLAWQGLPNYREARHVDEELPRQFGLLARLVEDGLPAMVVAGTCFEYGMQSGALHEGLPTRPDNPYGIAKDRLRQRLQALQALHPFALTWARLFYMHGEGQPATSLYPALRAAAQRGDAGIDMSGGEQLRDYLPVQEVARTLVRLALAPRERGVLNVSSGTPVSVRALVTRWIEQEGWTIAPAWGRRPYPDHEPMAFWGERQRLDAALESIA